MLLLAPTLAVFAAFTLYPIIDSLRTSFYRKSMFKPGIFIGIDNYIKVFTDQIFLKSLMNTAIVFFGSLILILPLSFLLGLFLHNQSSKGSAFRLISFMPNILSGIMVGLIWIFILDPGIGLINSFFNVVGLESLTRQWIGGVTLTPYSVVVVDLWRTVGFYAILFMAGLKMVPKETLEAAEIDGASNVQKIFHIIIPLLRETMKMCTVMIMIGALNTFQTVLMLTGGGPNMQSHVLPTYIYWTEFRQFDFGQGATMSVIMLAMVMFSAIAFLSLTRKRIED